MGLVDKLTRWLVRIAEKRSLRNWHRRFESPANLPLNFPYFEQKVLVLPLMQSKICA
jgi:hypothetical protein